jgi:hypothetical protein
MVLAKRLQKIKVEQGWTLFNFIKSSLDVMDEHEVFKGNCIVVDNAPLH